MVQEDSKAGSRNGKHFCLQDYITTSNVWTVGAVRERLHTTNEIKIRRDSHIRSSKRLRKGLCYGFEETVFSFPQAISSCLNSGQHKRHRWVWGSELWIALLCTNPGTCELSPLLAFGETRLGVAEDTRLGCSCWQLAHT